MKRNTKLPNTHPGEILKEEILIPANLTIVEAAHLLKTSRTNLSNIVNQKADITPNMAIRIAKVFGGNPAIWMRLQMSHDLRKAEEDFAKAPLDLEAFSM